MRFSLLTVATLVAAIVEASPTASNHVVHEKRDLPLKKWVKRDALNPRVVLPMRIGLVQTNLENGPDLLMELSDMDSPRYGQHLSAEEVIEFFAPPQSAVDAVREWLESAGVAAERIGHSANKQWIQFDASVAEAEELLKTKYHSYEHLGTGNENIGCEQYHVPEHISSHIDYITPGLKMLAGKPSKRKQAIRNEKRGFRTSSNQNFSSPLFGAPITLPAILSPAVQLSMCDTAITPACIAAMYNIPQATKADPTNMLGIFEEGDFYAAEDLIEFFALLAPNIPITTMPVLEGIDGGFAPSLYAGGESDLDFQISYPIIYPQNSVLYQTDDILYTSGVEASSGFLNTFFDAIDGSYCTSSAFGETGNAAIDPKYPDPNPLGYQGKLQCGVYKPTHVISISYGEQEDDLPTNYQQRQCAEVMKLGMQGTTVVLASGDAGVAARSTDDGNADGCLGKGEVFNPDFPASCPYLTALGATLLPTGASAAGDQEVAVTRFPSGGGFSNIYPQPSYQTNAVNTYLNNYVPNYKSYTLGAPTNNPTEAQTAGGLYNRGGRGYPDASAVGDNVVIINNGAPTLIGGTSASAPVFAAIINRINEERLSAGKPTVGFINPTMYANPGAFHDITVGNNSGCGTMGFVASKGWDPVTGLGTPNYPALLKVFMS